MTKTSTKKKSLAEPILNFATTIPNVNQTINQIPNYEDPGVSYKGYSKSLVDNNTYRLNKQNPFCSYRSSDGDFPDLDKSKTTYVNEICISIKTGLTSVDVGLTDGNSGLVKFMLTFDANTTYQVIIPILTPLIFNSGVYLGVVGTPSFILYNIMGWQE